MEFLRSSYLSLPEEPGVYQFFDSENRLLYVGKAKNLKARVSSYFTHSQELLEKTRVLVAQIHTIKITIVESELESLLLEVFLIQKLKPKYNVRMTDNKSYLLIRINVNDQYPAVLLTRRANDASSLYFGPYPSSSAVKRVLKILRRAFPYQSVVSHPKRQCLYNHLGLCPCPPVFDTPELRREYKQNIRSIRQVLEGKSRQLLASLEKERSTYSKNEAFEQAHDVQQKIDALSLITQPFHQPFEYDLNPNLRSDLRAQELSGLSQALRNTGMSITSLHRIECYDISNIQGAHATGSMVVFIDGEKSSSHYRRFKIKISGKPDDFAMMSEMLERRLKHSEWEMPDLIIVDGGKGQVSASMQVLQKNNLSISLIGLAKREETIIVPHNNVHGVSFSEVSLTKSNKALHLLMRVRDEAHRFAVTYHRKLRSLAVTA